MRSSPGPPSMPSNSGNTSRTCSTASRLRFRLRSPSISSCPSRLDLRSSLFALRSTLFDLRSTFYALRLLRSHHLKRSHHLVILVLEDVAMPHIPSCVSIKANDDARDHARLSANCIFPSHFIRIRRDGRSSELEFAPAQVVHDIEIAPVENLETHQMKMDG